MNWIFIFLIKMNSCEKSLLRILENNGFSKVRRNKGEATFAEYQKVHGCKKKICIMSILVTEIPANFIVVQCPDKRAPYQNKRPKVCDFLLFNWNKEQEVEVFFFELKKTRKENNIKLATKQIQGTRLWLQQYVIPKMKKELDSCKGLDKIHEHHVMLCERVGKPETGRAKSFFRYSADVEPVLSWYCSELMLDGVGCKKSIVSLQQIRDEAKA